MNQDSSDIVDTRETIATMLWHRFAPDHHIEWKYEALRAEYLDAADDVIAALRSPDAAAGAQLPPVDEVARIMWEGDHDGTWSDPHDGQDESKVIYSENASVALEFISDWQSADAAQRAPEQFRWRHKKRGSTYIEIGRGNLQIATDPIEEDDRVVIYQSEADGRLWVRGEAEFQDGRFEALPMSSTDRETTAVCSRCEGKGYITKPHPDGGWYTADCPTCTVTRPLREAPHD